MTEATAMRLLMFRVAAAGPVLDEALRDEALPYLETRPGLVECVAGRRGAAETGERIVVTTWRTPAAMAAALGEGPEIERLLTDHAEHVESARLETYDLAFSFRIEGDRPSRVLRVVTGQAAPGALDALVEAVHTAALRAATLAEGTVAYELGIRAPASFAAVSVWPDWAAIEQGTGASIHDASAILAPEHVASGHATHFEILEPDAARDAAANGPETLDLTRGR